MTRHSVITIGNFDGVHLGHRAILLRAGDVATKADANVVAVTFDPHPATVLRPDRVPASLMSTSDRVAALKAAGADEVHLLEPTKELLSKTPEQFIAMLKEQFQPIAFVEGHDFYFGKDRAGDVKLLQEIGKAEGFDVHLVDPVETTLHDQLEVAVGSSLIRQLLRWGRVADAGRCLGQPFVITSEVVKGEQRGRTINVPTANFDPDALASMCLPGRGVYAGFAYEPDRPGDRFAAAISVGTKPTFDQSKLAIETHLLDADLDLYGKQLSVGFTRWLRDQQRFDSVDELVAQLHRDIANVRQFDELESDGRKSA